MALNASIATHLQKQFKKLLSSGKIAVDEMF